MDKCPKCNNELHNVYFGDEARYNKIQYKRCLACGHIEIEKKEKEEK
jgi:Zn ribbon nucleic-acid-binding protein